MSYSHALWGGRFNPILLVDREETKELVDLFRVDLIIPIGDDEETKEFVSLYPHLINPFRSRDIFSKGTEHSHPISMVLDVQNAFVHMRDKPEWKAICEYGFKLYRWEDSDPLADVFLTTFGTYPSVSDVGTDYLNAFQRATGCTKIELDATKPVSAEATKQPSIAYMSRYGLDRHYSIRSSWAHPGFFVGNVGRLTDLVEFWNLRACDIPLQFIDPEHLDRYTEFVPAWADTMRERVANYRSEFDRKIAVWSASYDIDEACKAIDEPDLVRCSVSASLWNGLNVTAPMMYFGEESTLGVMSDRDKAPRVSFSFAEKPCCTDIWFHQQHLVASLSMIGGLSGDEQHTWHAPYIPELNEFYARKMFFHYDKLRAEPERIGIVIDAADHDAFLYALPVTEFIERAFELAGLRARISSAGLITKQLIARVGGLQGCRVFKIPGVRRLLKSHGLNSSISKRVALQDIGSKDPDRSDSSFDNHKDLHIEARPRDQKLTPAAVFSYLVGKDLFRIGADLKCPSCNLTSWISMEFLKHEIICELCGDRYNATRQLTDSNSWHYRRSGIMGVERNSQGAVPVALTLQQLDTSFHGGLHGSMYSPSLNLTPKDGKEGPTCETDFVWVTEGRHSNRTVIIIGECKDSLPIDENDVSNLRAVANAFPSDRFETYILFAKLVPFTDEEVGLAKTINDKYRHRVILLTQRELEPYFADEYWRADESTRNLNWYSPEAMAESTAAIYFDRERSSN